MIAAAVGTSLAADLGFAFERVDDGGHITFGDLEPLVSFLQETPADKLLPKVAEKLKSGTDLKTFVAAAGWPTPARSAARTTSASTRSWRWRPPTRWRWRSPSPSGSRWRS